MTSKLDQEELNRRLDNIDKKLIEVGKQYSSIQTSLDLIYDDRDLLTDIGEDISKVRGLVLSADKHNEDLTKSVEQTVEKKSEEVKFTVAESTDEVRKKLTKRVPEQIVDHIQKMFKKSDSGRKLKKKNRVESFLTSLKFWRKKSLMKGGE